MIALSLDDDRYPRRLRDLRRPPSPLWASGDLSALEADATVAIVGTRRMTPYGERVARALAESAARAGAVVVSGLAQGIDSTAHRGALDGDGRTVAVLGQGIADFAATVRGRREQLASQIRSRGAIVSEYPLGAPAQPWTFARRNATIAALADVVVVVEAPEGSGALITADLARQIGRPVFAVAGPLGSLASAGANLLIAGGDAQLLASADALIEALDLKAARRENDKVDPLVARALDALAAGAVHPDRLAADLGLDPGAAATLVARLLIGRQASTTPDGRIARA